MPSKEAPAPAGDHAANPPSAARTPREQVLRKLHSLSGVLPIGLFMVVHLWTNAKAVLGQDVYDAAVADMDRVPFAWTWELALLGALAFHAGYGLYLAVVGSPDPRAYPESRSRLHALQRASGVVALLFLGFHLWEMRLPRLLGHAGPSAFYPTLVAHLSSTTFGIPLVALVYVTGIAACAYHLANGLHAFAVTWDLAKTPRSQRIAGTAASVIGVLLFALGANTTLYFATGSRLFVPATLDAPRR